jgi:hypothetical protein
MADQVVALTRSFEGRRYSITNPLPQIVNRTGVILTDLVDILVGSSAALFLNVNAVTQNAPGYLRIGRRYSKTNPLPSLIKNTGVVLTDIFGITLGSSWSLPSAPNLRSVRAFGQSSLPTGDPAAAVIRYVAGTVKENKTLVNRRVRVYRRDTGTLLAQGISVSGRFQFSFSGYTGKIYIIAFDDTTFTPDLDARIFDLVDSVSG